MALTPKNRTELIANTVNQNLADNNARQITAAKLRETLNAIMANAIFPEDLPGAINTKLKTVTPVVGVYTATLADIGKYLECNSSSNCQIIILPGVFSAEDELLIEQTGDGNIQIVGGSGMTINSRGNASTTAGKYSVAGVKFKTSNTATLSGDII